MKNESIQVHGMHCAACAITIRKTLEKVPGVVSLDVNYATEKANIEYDNKKVDLHALSKKIEPLGYSLMHNMPHDHANHDHNAMLKEEELKQMRTKVLLAMPLTIIVFVLMIWEILSKTIEGFPMMIIPESIFVISSFLLATVFLFWMGRPYLKAIISFVRYRAANMDTLIGLGTATAYIYSSILLFFPQVIEAFKLNESKYFDVTIVVIGFITFGKYLEHSSKHKTGEAIKKLLNLQAKKALLFKDGKEMEVNVEDLKVGDVIAIKPGAKVAIDGEIIEGSSSIDESMITGEPIPVDKTVGDNLTGGTINKQGYLLIKVSKIGKDTMLSQIIKMVENAQGSRAPIQNLADKISEIFVPAVLLIAVISFIGWIFLGPQFVEFDQAFSFGLLSFVGVLVIACPCALGLATPTAVIVGVGLGASNGILVKNAEALEKLDKVKILVMDKTGTITKGKPTVTDVIVLNNKISKEELIQITASLEAKSEHPIASAIVEYSNKNSLEVLEFSNLEGKGISGIINSQKYFAGNLKLMEDLKISINENEYNELLTHGKTLVIIATDNEALGIIAVSDTIKDNAKDAINSLHKLGVKVVMLTGDDKKAANYIAEIVGIDEIYANVLPQEKAEIVGKLKKENKVAMAGDGINDAPSLALADVGIAMGTGTDVAIESADITLLGGDISKISKAFKLSKYTIRTIKQNLFWAFIYNIIGIPVASGILYPFFGIILNPVFAGGAMALSSVSVVLNSLRLKLAKI